MTNNISFAEEKQDCSEKNFVNNILCKSLGTGKDGVSKFSYGFDTNNIKDKKYLTDWFTRKK